MSYNVNSFERVKEGMAIKGDARGLDYSSKKERHSIFILLRQDSFPELPAVGAPVDNPIYPRCLYG